MIHVYGFDDYEHTAIILTKPTRKIVNGVQIGFENVIFKVDNLSRKNEYYMSNSTENQELEAWKNFYKVDRVSVPTYEEGFFYGLNENLGLSLSKYSLESFDKFKKYYSAAYKVTDVYTNNFSDPVYALLEACGATNTHANKSVLKLKLSNIQIFRKSVLEYARELRNKLVEREIKNPPSSSDFEAYGYKDIYPVQGKNLFLWITKVIDIEITRLNDGKENINNSTFQFFRSKEISHKDIKLSALLQIKDIFQRNYSEVKNPKIFSKGLENLIGKYKGSLNKGIRSLTYDNLSNLVLSLRNCEYTIKKNSIFLRNNSQTHMLDNSSFDISSIQTRPRRDTNNFQQKLPLETGKFPVNNRPPPLVRQEKFNNSQNSSLFLRRFIKFQANEQRFPADVIKIKNLPHMPSSLNLSNHTPLDFPPHIILDCPFEYQQELNQCGDASIQMIVSYHFMKALNKPQAIKLLKPLDDFLKEQKKRPFYDGVDESALKDKKKNLPIKDISINVNMKRKKCLTTQYLAYILYHFGPVILSFYFNEHFGHYCVLTGVYKQTVFLHDTWYGPNQHYSIETFNKYYAFNEDILYLPDLSQLKNPLYKKEELSKLYML